MDTPVLIVGAGPIGLALAGDLGFRGASCLLIEKSNGDVLQPRMDMVGIRSMEFCRRWGIVPWVENAGYNRAYPQDCAWVVSLTGYEFGREEFPAPRDEKPPPQSPQKRERCPQNFFDPVLKRFALQQPGVSIEYHTELVEFEERADKVISTVKDSRTGQTRQIESRYLIGTDGGGSRVREILGIKMTGEPVLTYTTNVVFRCANLEELHDKPKAYRYIFIGPEGTWSTLVAINGTDQWRFSLVGDSTKKTLTEQDLRAAIVRAVGRDFDFEILSIMPWMRRQLVADSYGTRRVFLAGDACHLTSPTGGFGMNTGILDAVNLSWKIAACLDGWGGEHLLESYGLEQRPVAVRNVTESTDNLKRMLSPRIASPSKIIFEEGAQGDAERVKFGTAYTEMMKREWHSIGIHLGYVYEGSPIVVPDGTPRPEDAVSSYVPTARPGSRAPHVFLKPNESIIDLFGKEFVLLCFDAETQHASELERAAQQHRIPFRTVKIDSKEAADIYQRKFVLVRPDGQVAWRGDILPADAISLLDLVRGAHESAVTDAAVSQ